MRVQCIPMRSVLIAVVDDEEPVRKALGRLLRAAGLTAECYASGQDFLDAIHRGPPSCLVLDLHMPGLSGFEVLERLRAQASRPPTIVITGHDEPENEVRCLAAGAVAYMRKPLDDEMLLQTIEVAVGKGISGHQVRG